MNNKGAGIIVGVGLVLVMVGLAAFTVNERDLAIKLRFGEVREANYVPGLHWKIPIIETVRKFPRRILKIDDAPQEVFTLDRQNMTVDFFVKWRIVDEVSFYTSTGGSQQVAADRLREIIKNSVVTEFGKRSTREAISVERMELMRDMLALARPTAEGLGVELVDFRVKQVEFVARVRESVYEQMRAEREQLAAQTRAEGREAAALITSTADKDRTVILADADRQLGLEALYMDGPWSLQAEAFWRNLDGAAGDGDGDLDLFVARKPEVDEPLSVDPLGHLFKNTDASGVVFD